MRFVVLAVPSGPRWHRRYIDAFQRGSAAHAARCVVHASDNYSANPGDVPIMFGPNYFPNTYRSLRRQGIEFLTVNRCLWGDVDDDVAIGWNGFNGGAEFGEESHRSPSRPWPEEDLRENLSSVVLIVGEYPSPCDSKSDIAAFYRRAIEQSHGMSVVIREHPNYRGRLPEDLRALVRNRFPLDQVFMFRTYSSTFGAELALRGARVVPERQSALYHLPSVSPANVRKLCARAQHHISEIGNGDFWARLKHGRDH